MSEGLNTPTKVFVVVALVVIVLVIGFVFFGFNPELPSNSVEYNYFTFYEIGGLWQTSIQLDGRMYDAVFRFNPTQVEDVYVAGEFKGFNSSTIYVTFDPLSESQDFAYLALGVSELTLHLARALNYSVVAACTRNETDACVDRPVVTCDGGLPVVELVADAPTQITLDNRCIRLSGEGFELLRSVDRLLFQWYKIMNAAQ